MNLLTHVPNAITCLNLLCGYLGIILAFQGNLEAAALLIYLAGFFDFMDGFVARLLKANSPIGKELDSLADVITFGVLPGILIFKLSTINHAYSLEGLVFSTTISWYAYFSAVLPIFSALRLAKFNIDIRQTSSFLGLPTPANAMFIATLPFIYMNKFIYDFDIIWIQITPVIVGIIMSALLVSELPLMALKFNSFGYAKNKLKYTLIILSLVWIIVFHFFAAPFIMISYIVISLLDNKKEAI